MVTSLTWVGFKELFFKRFTSEYKKLCEGINLLQKRYTGFNKAYVHDFNAQMNVISKNDKFPNKCIVLSEGCKSGW